MVQKDELLLKFISDNEKLIDENRFDEIYRILENSYNKNNFDVVIGSFTDLLYQNGINPLLYMTRIPSWFCLNSSMEKLIFPENIHDYSECVLSEAIKEVVFTTRTPNVNLGPAAFSYVKELLIRCTNVVFNENIKPLIEHSIRWSNKKIRWLPLN